MVLLVKDTIYGFLHKYNGTIKGPVVVIFVDKSPDIHVKFDTPWLMTPNEDM